jgi:uncharacterized membrane protein YqjE
MGAPAKDGTLSVELLDAIKILRSTGSLLLDHAALIVRLAQVEWAEERARLRGLLLALVAGAALSGVALLHLSALVLMLLWNTPYRIHVLVLLTAVYIGGTALIWRRFARLARQGGDPFAGSRRELSQTLSLLRSRL